MGRGINKIIAKFLANKRKGTLDDPGNTFESFLHLTLSKNISNKNQRYLYESSFDERRQKGPPEFNYLAEVDSRSSSVTNQNSIAKIPLNDAGRNSFSKRILRNNEPSKQFQPINLIRILDTLNSVSEDVRKYSEFKKMKNKSIRVYETIDSLSPRLRRKYYNNSTSDLNQGKDISIIFIENPSVNNKEATLDKNSSLKQLNNSNISFEKAFDEKLRNLNKSTRRGRSVGG